MAAQVVPAGAPVRAVRAQVRLLARVHAPVLDQLLKGDIEIYVDIERERERESSNYLFQLDGAEYADVAAEVAVVPVAAHVLAQVDLGRAVGPADGAADSRLRGRAPGVRAQVPLEGLLDRAGVRAQRAAVLFSFVPTIQPFQMDKGALLGYISSGGKFFKSLRCGEPFAEKVYVINEKDRVPVPDALQGQRALLARAAGARGRVRGRGLACLLARRRAPRFAIARALLLRLSRAALGGTLRLTRAAAWAAVSGATGREITLDFFTASFVLRPNTFPFHQPLNWRSFFHLTKLAPANC